ncbi:MAG TPA: outer membrane beta-barrel protein [Vicinamibacterales bacterium]
MVVLTVSMAVTPAWAQRAPAPGMWAVGGSIGATTPADPSLDNGLEVAGNVEGYLTSRLSIRGQLAGSSWDIVGRGFTGTVSPIRLDGNVVYNWEGGVVHPYVTAGLGMYHFRSTISGAADGADTNAGIDIGGGIEYFFQRHATITGEVLYHRVDAFNTPVTTFNEGSFWSFDVGLKAYIKH